MRNFVFMICGIIFGGLLIGNLAACSAPPPEEIPDPPAVIQAAEPLPEDAALLREVPDRQALPDGTLLDCTGAGTLQFFPARQAEPDFAPGFDKVCGYAGVK